MHVEPSEVRKNLTRLENGAVSMNSYLRGIYALLLRQRAIVDEPKKRSQKMQERQKYNEESQEYIDNFVKRHRR